MMIYLKIIRAALTHTRKKDFVLNPLFKCLYYVVIQCMYVFVKKMKFEPIVKKTINKARN